MDQEFANRLFSEGAALVVLNVPPKTEVGIDMKSWNTGERFKGIKMIPPGIHFVYYSAVSKDGQTAPRTGFFYCFKPKEVLVKIYDPLTEELTTESEEQTERIKQNLQNLDRELGPYPLETWRQWVSLSQHITEDYLNRVLPLSRVVTAVADLVAVEGTRPSSVTKDPESKKKQKTGTSSSRVCGSNLPAIQEDGDTQLTAPSNSSENDQKSGLPEMVNRPGSEWRWTTLPKRPFKIGASPAEVTSNSMDSSYLLECLLSDAEKDSELLSELQLCFLVFLVGQSWNGWERWKTLIDVFCRAEVAMQRHADLFSKIIAIFHYQIQEVPEDLFIDIVEQENFLAASLATLFANIADNSTSVPASLVSRANKFREHLTTRFKWSFDLEGNEEEAPVVVEL